MQSVGVSVGDKVQSVIGNKLFVHVVLVRQGERKVIVDAVDKSVLLGRKRTTQGQTQVLLVGSGAIKRCIGVAFQSVNVFREIGREGVFPCQCPTNGVCPRGVEGDVGVCFQLVAPVAGAVQIVNVEVEHTPTLAKGETFTQRSIENIVLHLNATVERRKSGAAIDDNGAVT